MNGSIVLDYARKRVGVVGPTRAKAFQLEETGEGTAAQEDMHQLGSNPVAPSDESQGLASGMK